MPPLSPPPQEPVAPDLEQQRREQAIQRIRDKRAFMIHLVAYLVVNVWFVVMWAITWSMTGFGYFWPIFPMIGWGAGVAVHGYCVHGGEKMSETQIQREMQRLP
jgi:hypothetical protein